ncbi:MAG: efflux RND transporter periplasmic adaptor subunit [Pseudomonadota bacterium]
MPRLRRALLIVGLLGGAGLITALLISNKPTPEKKETRTVDALVEVLPVASETVSLRVESQGTVIPRTETVLSAEVAGAIVDISPKFIAGGAFGRREVLMRIDPTNYQVAVDQAEALLAQRQIEYDGAAKLRSQGYRAESEYASAAAALASARAELVRAERNLERTQIRLPYAGMVRAKEADLGQYVNVGSRLGVTFATDAAEVRLPLTDQDLAFVALPGVAGGDGPAVRLSATQRGVLTEWRGRIVRTEGVVDENTRVTFAVARVEDPYLRQADPIHASPLPIGTFVAASIQGTTVEDVIRIPRSALRGNGQLVVVDEENRLRIRDVDIIRADGRNVYVSAGVSSGERISLTPIENPVNGMRVRTNDTTAADERGVPEAEQPEETR